MELAPLAAEDKTFKAGFPVWRTPGTTEKWDGGIAVGPDGNIKRDLGYPLNRSMVE